MKTRFLFILALIYAVLPLITGYVYYQLFYGVSARYESTTASDVLIICVLLGFLFISSVFFSNWRKAIKEDR